MMKRSSVAKLDASNMGANAPTTTTQIFVFVSRFHAELYIFDAFRPYSIGRIWTPRSEVSIVDYFVAVVIHQCLKALIIIGVAALSNT